MGKFEKTPIVHLEKCRETVELVDEKAELLIETYCGVEFYETDRRTTTSMKRVTCRSCIRAVGQ